MINNAFVSVQGTYSEWIGRTVSVG